MQVGIKPKQQISCQRWSRTRINYFASKQQGPVNVQCKDPVCNLLLQQSYMWGNKLGGSQARGLACHPCPALPLGPTVQGVEGDEKAFLGHWLVSLHLHKATILLKFLGLLFPQTKCFSSAPHMQMCLLTPGRPMPGSCAGHGGRCVHISPCCLSLEDGAMLTSREAPVGRNWPCLAGPGSVGPKV